MRRNIPLISAAVTTFSLVMLASIVYAYRAMAAAPQSIQEPGQARVEAGADVSPPLGLAAPSDISPQEAAAQAAKYLNRTDAFSVELTVLNGAQCYKVTFSSGDIAFVALNGEILGSAPAPAAEVVASVTTRRHSGERGRGVGGGRSGGHEDGGGDGGGGESGDGD